MKGSLTVDRSKLVPETTKIRIAIHAHEFVEVVHKQRQINVIKIEVCKTFVMQNWALTVIHWLANHSTDYGISIHGLQPVIPVFKLEHLNKV